MNYAEHQRFLLHHIARNLCVPGTFLEDERSRNHAAEKTAAEPARKMFERLQQLMIEHKP
jgi:hypothetical protein